LGGKKVEKNFAGWSEVYPVKPICFFCLTGAEIPIYRGRQGSYEAMRKYIEKMNG